MMRFTEFCLLSASENEVMSARVPRCRKCWPRSAFLTLPACGDRFWFFSLHASAGPYNRLRRQLVKAAGSPTSGGITLLTFVTACLLILVWWHQAQSLRDTGLECRIFTLEAVGLILFCFCVTEHTRNEGQGFRSIKSFLLIYNEKDSKQQCLNQKPEIP